MSKSPLLLSFVVGAVLGFGLSRVLTPAHEVRPVAASEVTARAKEILSQPEPLHRLAGISALLESLGPESVPAVTAAFENAPIDGGDPELIVVATWWAAFDPTAALAWTSSDWRAGYGAVIAAVFRSWAHLDPEAALRNAGSLRYPGQLDLAKDAIYAGWDESGKPGLGEVFNQMPMREQQRLAQILARRRVVTMGVKGALEWGDAFPNTGMRELLSVRVASVAAGSTEGARQVAEWASPRIASAKKPTGYPRRIGTRWVQHDPQAAMTWLSTLPAGVDRDDGVAESFRDWMMKDFPAAESWVKQQSQGEIQQWAESAISIFAKTNGLARPQESLELVGRFQDQELRDSTSVIILMHWLKNDRPAAGAWLAKSDLSADVKERAENGATRISRPIPGQPILPVGPLGPEGVN